MTDLDPERSAGGSQLEGQVQFVSDGDAVLAHGRDRGLSWVYVLLLLQQLTAAALAVGSHAAARIAAHLSYRSWSSAEAFRTLPAYPQSIEELLIRCLDSD
jgi:hypothetical protein